MRQAKHFPGAAYHLADAGGKQHLPATGLAASIPRVHPVALFALLFLLCLPLQLRAQGSAGGNVQAEGNAPASRAARDWSFEVGVGGEYDTNVTVDEVDLSSGQSDFAWIADFNVAVKQPLGEKTRLSLSYDISSANYRQFSRVDRLTQIAGADLSTELGKVSAGVSAYYIDSRLDGEGFLRYQRLSPSLSGFLSKRWFARGAYVYSARKIDERESRDADTQSIEADLYYFHRGLRSYLNIGYRFRDEDSVGPEFDFYGNAFKLRYIRRIDFAGKRWKAEAALRYERRDYRFPEPTIEEEREDKRLQIKLDLEVPLTERATWQLYYSYGDYDSNLPRADFFQNIGGMRVQFAW